jgi:ribonucleotide reductase beta subunit family protein with ferritin-like domain
MSLLKATGVYKPFQYPWAYEFWKRQQQVHWLPEEVPLGEDCRDWAHKLNEHERNLLTQIFRFFTQADVEVQDCYHEKYGRVFKPTEIKMMLASFSNMECFDKETELLTSAGWKCVVDITMDDVIAQYAIKSGEVSFVKPKKVVKYPYQGKMHHYLNDETDIMVTPNHDMIVSKDGIHVTKVKSQDLTDHGGWMYPYSGKAAYQGYSLTDLEALFVGLRSFCVSITPPEHDLTNTLAVGFVSRAYADLMCDHITKLDGVSVELKDSGDEAVITFDDPVSYRSIVDLTFVDLAKISKDVAGHILSTANANNRGGQNVYDALAAMVSLPREMGGIPWSPYPTPTEVDYDDYVYCVSVDTENLVTRRNGKVAFTGNTIHIAAYSHLLDTIGMPESEYSAFMEYSAMKDKHDYLAKFGVDTDEDIARTLAMFGGFTEGVQLFASFAMLMNFPRFNKMKGMGQIVTYSVRDECVSDDTEVLTPEGWVKFPDLKDGDPVIQFDQSTMVFSSAIPDRVVRKPYVGDLIEIDTSDISIAVTPMHDILHYGRTIERFVKTKAGMLEENSTYTLCSLSDDGSPKLVDIESSETRRVPYDGVVYCVSVPTGNFVVRRNGKAHVTGNSLHCEGITKLFKEFVQERDCLTPSVKNDIIEQCHTTIKLEDAFIDLAFEQGPVTGMNALDIKRYIRYVADWRLQMLGFDPIFHIPEHPIPWLIPLLNGVEHANFFEQRASEYSRVATSGNWNDTWDNFDRKIAPKS